MGIVKNKGLSGVVGNVVAYTVGDQEIIRSRPAKVKRTPAMKRRGANFGHATRISGQVRSALKEKLHDFSDTWKGQARLTGAIVRWLGTTPIKQTISTDSVPWLADFRFNKDAELNGNWKRLLQLTFSDTNSLMLTIPEFVPASAIVTAPRTTFVRCTITALTFQLSNGEHMQYDKQEFEIPVSQSSISPQSIPLNIKRNKGELILVVLSQVCLKGQNNYKIVVEDKQFCPAEVIGALYTGN